MAPPRSPKKREFDGRKGAYFAIAEAARRIGRSRPVIMSWLPGIREAIQDERGRWYLPEAAVERLAKDAAERERLARLTAKTRNRAVAQLRRDVEALRTDFEALKQEVGTLKARKG